MSKAGHGKYGRIVQMLPILAYGDAIGNEVLAIHHMLEDAGYTCEICANVVDQKIRSRVKARSLKHISRFRDSADTLVVYHLSTGSFMNKMVADLQADVVIWYHNITPASFFAGFDRNLEKACLEGRTEAVSLRSKPVLCIADSEYNRQELMEMGYTCPVVVIPILLAYDDYAAKPDQSVLDRYRPGQAEGHGQKQAHIIFTGRVAPNKKQQDLISSFYYYHKYYNANSTLHIVGSCSEESLYYQSLAVYVQALGLEDSVHFTGHIPFSQILAYYRLADLFLCLSEHEGFCVPLLEAMYFDVPIIAYDSTAVGETLGKAGLLLEDKAPELVAESMHYMMDHPDLRSYLILQGRQRLQDFAYDRVKAAVLRAVEDLGQGPA